MDSGVRGPCLHHLTFLGGLLLLGSCWVCVSGGKTEVVRGDTLLAHFGLSFLLVDTSYLCQEASS